MNNRKQLFLRVSLAAFVASIGGSNALARDVIVVNAQKRAQDVLDVPVSVSAFDAEDLKSRGVRAFEDLATVTPGVFLTTSGSLRATRVNIRGITSTPTSVGFESGIGSYVDGIVQGRATTLNNDLVDIASVEILRGPQGTLFGRNSVAGVFNIFSVKPQLGEASASLNAGYGNFDAMFARGVVNLPLGDAAALRLNGFYRKRDGYLENTTLGLDHNNIDRYGFRGQLLFQPSESLEIIARGSFTDDEAMGNSVEPVTVGSHVSEIDRIIAQSYPDFQTRSTSDASLEINWDIGGGYTVTSLSGYSQFEFATFTELLGFGGVATGVAEEQDQFSQELRIASPDDERFRWLLGAYYFDQSLLNHFDIDFLGTNVPGHVSDISTEAFALFGQVDFDLTDQLTLTGGVRWTREKKDAFYDQPANGAFGISAVMLDEAITDKEPTWTAKLTYDLSDTVIAYGSYSRGFKASGFNVSGALPMGSGRETFLINPETVDSFEIGSRGSLLDDKLIFTLAGYYTQYDDRQVFDIVNVGGLLLLESANRSSEVWGAELETQYYVNDMVTLGGTYGFMDATINDPDPAFDGNVAERSPRNQVTLFAQISSPINDTSLVGSFRTDYSYTGGYYDQDDNNPDEFQKAFSLINMRAALGDQNDRWELAVWVKNIADVTYSLDYFDSDQLVPNIGRTFGGEISVNF